MYQTMGSDWPSVVVAIGAVLGAVSCAAPGHRSDGGFPAVMRTATMGARRRQAGTSRRCPSRTRRKGPAPWCRQPAPCGSTFRWRRRKSTFNPRCRRDWPHPAGRGARPSKSAPSSWRRRPGLPTTIGLTDPRSASLLSMPASATGKKRPSLAGHASQRTTSSLSWWSVPPPVRLPVATKCRCRPRPCHRPPRSPRPARPRPRRSGSADRRSGWRRPAHGSAAVADESAVGDVEDAIDQRQRAALIVDGRVELGLAGISRRASQCEGAVLDREGARDVTGDVHPSPIAPATKIVREARR